MALRDVRARRTDCGVQSAPAIVPVVVVVVEVFGWLRSPAGSTVFRRPTQFNRAPFFPPSMSSARFASLGSHGAAAAVPQSEGAPRVGGKRGRLSAMGAPSSAKQPRVNATGALPSAAPVMLSVNHYGSSAADHVDKWPAGQPCWQIQLVHEAWPSYASFFVDSFNTFLHRSAVDEAEPRSVHELQQMCNMRVQITRADGAEAPVAPWRPAVYAAGNEVALGTALTLLLDYMNHRAEWAGPRDFKPFPIASTQAVHVHLPESMPHLQAPALARSNVRVHRGPPVHGWWQVAGPLGNKWLRLDVEFDEEGAVALGWSGQTYSLRAAFDDAEVGLCEDGAGGFLRVLNGQKTSISSQEDIEKLVKIIRDDLHQFPCLVHVEPVPQDDPVTGKTHELLRGFVTALQSLGHLHVRMAAA